MSDPVDDRTAMKQSRLSEQARRTLRRRQVKCVDSDFLITILRRKENAERKISDQDQENMHATISVNSFEFFCGAYKSQEKSGNLRKTCHARPAFENSMPSEGTSSR